MTLPSPPPAVVAGRAVAFVLVGIACERRRGAVTRGDLGEHAADTDGVALGGVDLDHGAGDGRGDFRIHLVGGDLDECLVLGDLVAFLLMPLQD